MRRGDGNNLKQFSFKEKNEHFIITTNNSKERD